MSTEARLIYDKLEEFINKYYQNQLIKGSLIFLLYLLVSYLLMIVAEYFWYFSIPVRTFLFYAFIILSILILSVFVIKPLFSFLKITKRIDYYQVSKIIEQHFPDIKDHLRNVLELNNLKSNTYSQELIEAAIQQKTKELSPIPFHTAIKIRQNLKYSPWILLPTSI